MIKLVSIDQSIAKTAWCLFEGQELKRFGVAKTSKKDGDLYTRCKSICCDLADNISTKITANYEEFFCREGLGFGNSKSNASRDLAYLVGYLECFFGEAMLEVPPTSLKKFATGTGKADKDQMVAALPKDVYDRFINAGYKKTTGLQDLADAYFIGKYFIEKEV